PPRALHFVPTRRSSDLALMFVRVFHRGWRYLHCHDLDFLADGQRVLTSDAEHEGRTLGGPDVAEQIAVSVERAQLVRMAWASERSEEHTSELQSRENLV